MLSRPAQQADNRRPRPGNRTRPPPHEPTPLVSPQTQRDRRNQRNLYEQPHLTTNQQTHQAIPTQPK
ncbi:hypothetical protein, partial [Nocardia cyriacigeorgica]|uniref:hypothetical protein n=1 Tax=Nocardia cyriacigeorgica TaxID=135487 RepID=UPI002454D758